MLRWIDLPSKNNRFRKIWAGMLVLVVGLAALGAYAGSHQLTSTWRGIVAGLLLVLYLGWMFAGWFHRLPLRSQGVTIRLIAWFGALAIALALTLISSHFTILLWILFGSTPFYLGTRVGLIPMIGVLVLIGFLQAGGVNVPHGSGEWESLAGWLIGAAIWILLILAIERLVRQRAENEQLIADLKASQAQIQQAAVQERELVVLRERERLARDLHDIIGHALVLASVKLEAAQRLSRVDRERAASELTATQQLLRQTMTELRQAVTNLRTIPEEPVSLAHDIEEQVAQIGIRANVAIEPIAGLSLIEADALRRIAQEALTNVVKHAAPTAVSVSLQRQGDAVVLEVADNGRGFNPTDAGAIGHFGIRGMRERIELAGGSLTIESAPGNGTRVRATVPVAAADDHSPPEMPEVTRGAA